MPVSSSGYFCHQPVNNEDEHRWKENASQLHSRFDAEAVSQEVATSDLTLSVRRLLQVT